MRAAVKAEGWRRSPANTSARAGNRMGRAAPAGASVNVRGQQQSRPGIKLRGQPKPTGNVPPPRPGPGLPPDPSPWSGRSRANRDTGPGAAWPCWPGRHHHRVTARRRGKALPRQRPPGRLSARRLPPGSPSRSVRSTRKGGSVTYPSAQARTFQPHGIGRELPSLAGPAGRGTAAGVPCHLPWCPIELTVYAVVLRRGERAYVHRAVL